MNLYLVAFYALGLLSLVAAFGVVAARNVVYSVLFLLLALLGIAGIYILLFAEFLALVQVLIYGGAITLVLLFALMLTRIREFPVKLDNPQRPLAAVAALAVFVLLSVTAYATRWPLAAERPSPTGFGAVGQLLFSQWTVPFEIASLVLLVALVGAVVVARPGGRE